MSTHANAPLTPEGRRRLWGVGKNAVTSRNRAAVARAKGRLRGKQPKLSAKQQTELRRMHTAGDDSIADLAELFNIVQAGSRQAPRSRSGAGSCQGKVQMSGVVRSLASELHSLLQQAPLSLRAQRSELALIFLCLLALDLPQHPGEQLVRDDGALGDLGIVLAEAGQGEQLARVARLDGAVGELHHGQALASQASGFVRLGDDVELALVVKGQ